VLLEKPSSLRVEILGFLNQSQAVLVTDGDRFEVYRAHDHSYESGQVDDGLLWNEAGISLSPEEAVSVLLGAPTFESDFSPAGAVRDGDGRIRIDLNDANGVLRQRVTFDPAGPLHGFELLDTRGATLWSAQFREYRDVGGISFAHAISLDVAAGMTHAEISFRHVELNPALPAELFRLRLPAGQSPPAPNEPPR
jgi:outer membrane lipoprotein-sorting protein